VNDVPFTPLSADPDGASVFTCTLCGTRFTHGGQGCGACPLNAGCDVVSCPTCGHTFPRSSRIVGWVRRMLTRIGLGPDRREEKRPW
jgi:hypothetical protein